MDFALIIRTIKEKITDTDRSVFLIILSFSLIALTRWVFGFVPGLMLLATIPLFFLSLLRPKAGVLSLIVLTVLFERFFTLESFQFGTSMIKLYPLDIVLFGVYVGVLAKMIYGKARFFLDRVSVFLILFFVLASIYFIESVIGFNTEDISVAFSTWKNYVFYGVLFFVLPLILENESDIKQVVKYFLFAVVLGIIFIIIGVIRGEGLWTEFTPLSTEGVRLLSFPHAFYFSLAVLGMIVTGTFWEQYRYRAVLWIALALWIFGIVGSLMRHMWIGMFVSLIFSYVFLFDRTLRIRTKRMFLVVFISSSVLLFSAFFLTLIVPTSTIGHRVQSIVETVSLRLTSIGSTADTSISWRGSTWSSAFSALSENPLFGTGFGVRIPVESGEYRDFVEIRNIHNSWLALLVQMGVLGYVVLSIFLFDLISRIWRISFLSPFLEALRMALLTLVCYQGVVFLAQPYLETNLTSIFFWLTLGLIQTLLTLVKKNKAVSL
ncbi:MAG: O-antigen ligase family protein [Candidatus Moranbacteria bacterium]|nr:O-antigen ligase family protein [Candidatus Moranbacteria bacterium]MDD3964990.1 O-antigen ligase family protein [Candidatus Moranbacteria bacterium]